MEIVILIGRIVFSMLFIGSGMGHLTQADASAEYAKQRGVPSSKLAVQLSGVFLLAGGVGIITGIWIDLALLGIALLVLIMGFAMHPFWTMTGQEQQGEMAHFMKNLSIAGAALALFGLFAWGYDGATIIGPVFNFG